MRTIGITVACLTLGIVFSFSNAGRAESVAPVAQDSALSAPSPTSLRAKLQHNAPLLSKASAKALEFSKRKAAANFNAKQRAGLAKQSALYKRAAGRYQGFAARARKLLRGAGTQATLPDQERVQRMSGLLKEISEYNKALLARSYRWSHGSDMAKRAHEAMMNIISNMR